MNTLETSDRDLLLQFIELREDFSLLAAKTSTHLMDLYAWAALPHIQAYLSFHRAHLRYLQERDARQSLHAVVISSESPQERTRAATSLLRSLRDSSRATRSATPAPSTTAIPQPPSVPTPTPTHAAHPPSHPTSFTPITPITRAEVEELSRLLPSLLRDLADLPPAQQLAILAGTSDSPSQTTTLPPPTS